MVNLLGPRRPGGRLTCLDADRHGPVEARLRTLAELVRHDRLRSLAGLEAEAIEGLEVELEELAASPSRVAALALLEAIDGLRSEARARTSSDPIEGSRSTTPLAGGDYVCHRPGRSLATGEAEIASRGYFDVQDRPPIASWIGVLASQPARAAEDDEGAIIAWVAAGDLVRARAGCEACESGALRLLADLAPEAHRQLRALESAIWPEAPRTV